MHILLSLQISPSIAIGVTLVVLFSRRPRHCLGWLGSCRREETGIEGAPRASGDGRGRKPLPLVFRKRDRHPDP